MGYSASLAPTVKMRTLLAFAVAMTASAAFELTKTNNGGNVVMFMPEEEVDYTDLSSVSEETVNDVDASDSIGRYSFFDGTVYDTDSYDGDFNDDNTSGDVTDIYEAEGQDAEVQSLDEEGREGGLREEHGLHKRSPQDPNALYQFPAFKKAGKKLKKVGKKSEEAESEAAPDRTEDGEEAGEEGHEDREEVGHAPNQQAS